MVIKTVIGLRKTNTTTMDYMLFILSLIYVAIKHQTPSTSLYQTLTTLLNYISTTKKTPIKSIKKSKK